MCIDECLAIHSFPIKNLPSLIFTQLIFLCADLCHLIIQYSQIEIFRLGYISLCNVELWNLLKLLEVHLSWVSVWPYCRHFLRTFCPICSIVPNLFVYFLVLQFCCYYECRSIWVYFLFWHCTYNVFLAST